MKRLFFAILCLLVPAGAHVGVNDVFFEGQAGPYPFAVTIRPPVVIPGVAEISIRAQAQDVAKIRITPMTLTGAGSLYPPTPDEAVRSKMDPQQFDGSLWIMSPGIWQVRMLVEGARGSAVLSVPVPATSQKISSMDATTGTILAVLLGLLVVGLAGIAGAAAGEALTPAGEAVSPESLRVARWARGLGLLAGVGVTALGWAWWSAEASDYGKSVYKPLAMTAKVEGGQLVVDLAHTGWFQKKTLDDFLLDHGYPMHLYLMREPGQDVIYHLHPKVTGRGHFETPLPALGAGVYRVFADIVHQNGFPETLATRVDCPELRGSPLGPDDAGGVFSEESKSKWSFKLKNGGQVVLDRPETPWRAGRAVSLRFRVLDGDGNPAPNLKPYLGMPAHLAIVRSDFQVFAHIHPSGSISMAAFELAQKNLLSLNPNVIPSGNSMDMEKSEIRSEFQFPFGFPQAGTYRMLLQFRTLTGVESASFVQEVLP